LCGNSPRKTGKGDPKRGPPFEDGALVMQGPFPTEQIATLYRPRPLDQSEDPDESSQISSALLLAVAKGYPRFSGRVLKGPARRFLL